ncbi:endonuclease/exonuclease/phosphatase family metal-dependent hydrolase [Anseongella ginsenosidimutans]|uniref:Endonuclease/exonuclease/phosphatase family metal-dependent hydrolase n=1 Tax=Anseongella ginsenosidimutans TaxID=496056 RepID=A0A4R3KRU1_9SPHI|nr:endonuclease/exonuclease/phosphatase family protein [Anseongella ginsenosidimutans]QEC53130.1 endonuclease [Anseongella ginsenosidimutans]TCS87752.1 endonuclease/exonuclease/phosphatase family metal-dependent hydrolase [Anseongella ginsenosidimutans]
MNKALSILSLLLLLSFAGFAQDKTITVMTYNIYHGEMAYERGKSNLAEIARVINKYKPDFVALQEVDSLTGRSAALNNGTAQNLAKELATLTGMQGYFGKAMDYDGGGYGEGVLSRHPATPANHVLPNPEGGEPRALLIVRAEVPGLGPLVFAGTHLCHQFDGNKIAQTEAIVDILGDSQAPVLMGGDFNFRPESKPYDIITGSFSDAALVKGDPQFTIPYDEPRARIDYIFFSPGDHWQVLDVKVLREDASDHMPVLVKLKLKE